MQGVASSPVSDTQGCIQQDEDKELLVKQFIDAPFPTEKQLGEAPKASIGYFQGV